MITSIRQNGKIIKTTIETASQKISFINLGASIIQWMTQDGKEIVPAYLDYNDYQMQEKPGMYLGATIGPVAGRIKNSSFDLNNRHYSITADYPSFLHSGKESFAFKYFEISETGKDSLGEFIIYKLNYKHPVFPADLVVFVRYTVNPGNTGCL